MNSAFYNDTDKYACEWLENLMKAGKITPGPIFQNSIQEIKASDVEPYNRAHFFAGIAGWERALQLAGWPADRPVWTGSCPCQPFSAAGKRKGTADKRHLWPDFYRLICECKPPIIFGEQVASKDGRKWLDGVFADLERVGYAVAGADLCAAGVGAPHIRQRLYWVAYAEGFQTRPTQSSHSREEAAIRWPDKTSSYRGFVSSSGWSYRIPEPEVPFVVDGFSGILGRIGAYGNAIVPPLAALFIQSVMEVLGI